MSIGAGSFFNSASKVLGFRGTYAVFGCYLDDSYTDVSGVVTLAGYVAPLDGWVAFEQVVEDIFCAEGVSVLHAIDFRRGSGDFKDWSRDRKRQFIEEVFKVAAASSATGLSVSVKRSVWAEFKKIDRRNSGSSPLGMAFGLALMLVCDNPPGELVSFNDDCAFVVEQGNKNNAEISQIFNRHKKQGTLEKAKSLAFAAKNDSRAIQLADFWAYYSRRLALKVIAGGPIRSNSDLSSYVEPELINAVNKTWHTVQIANGPVKRLGPNHVEIGKPTTFYLGPLAK